MKSEREIFLNKYNHVSLRRFLLERYILQCSSLTVMFYNVTKRSLKLCDFSSKEME